MTPFGAEFLAVLTAVTESRTRDTAFFPGFRVPFAVLSVPTVLAALAKFAGPKARARLY